MNSDQLLQQTQAVDAISRELGVDQATAQAGAAALLPQILSGFQQPAAAPQSAIGGGLGGLIGTIGGLGGGGLLDNVTSSEPTEIDKGNQILGQIFGSKDGSRAVAAEAAAQSGVEPSLLKKMLPILAMVVAGYVMKRAGQGSGGGGGGGLGGGGPSGGLGDAIDGMLGEQSTASGSASEARPAPAGDSVRDPHTAPGAGDILGQLIGAAGKFLRR
jgi:hypothetical protein